MEKETKEGTTSWMLKRERRGGYVASAIRRCSGFSAAVPAELGWAPRFGDARYLDALCVKDWIPLEDRYCYPGPSSHNGDGRIRIEGMILTHQRQRSRRGLLAAVSPCRSMTVIYQYGSPENAGRPHGRNKAPICRPSSHHMGAIGCLQIVLTSGTRCASGPIDRLCDI